MIILLYCRIGTRYRRRCSNCSRVACTSVGFIFGFGVCIWVVRARIGGSLLFRTDLFLLGIECLIGRVVLFAAPEAETHWLLFKQGQTMGYFVGSCAEVLDPLDDIMVEGYFYWLLLYNLIKTTNDKSYFMGVGISSFFFNFLGLSQFSDKYFCLYATFT